jgi:hypothetical protein
MRSTAILLLICSCVFSASAFRAVGGGKKRSSSSVKRLSVSASFLNAAVSMPTKPFNGKLNPGVNVGLRTAAANGTKHLQVGVDLGYAYQAGLQSFTYIKPNLGYKFNVSKAVSVSPIVGAGILMSRRLNSEYQPTTGGNGSVNFVSSTPWSPQFMTSIGIEPSVLLYKGSGVRANVFMRYDFATQTNFATISTLLPITIWQLGLRLQGE